jgi:hypothetical protein
MVTMEFFVFEEEGVRGPNLCMAFECLKTVSPTSSVESKRGFS